MARRRRHYPPDEEFLQVRKKCGLICKKCGGDTLYAKEMNRLFSRCERCLVAWARSQQLLGVQINVIDREMKLALENRGHNV